MWNKQTHTREICQINAPVDNKNIPNIMQVSHENIGERSEDGFFFRNNRQNFQIDHPQMHWSSFTVFHKSKDNTYSLISRSWSTSWGFVKSGSWASKWIMYGTTYSGSRDKSFSGTIRHKSSISNQCIEYKIHIEQQKAGSEGKESCTYTALTFPLTHFELISYD